ncbi:hypothetical protein VTN96DRAFT_143 [Rasamsonia emersonii]
MHILTVYTRPTDLPRTCRHVLYCIPYPNATQRNATIPVSKYNLNLNLNWNSQKTQRMGISQATARPLLHPSPVASRFVWHTHSGFRLKRKCMQCEPGETPNLSIPFHFIPFDSKNAMGERRTVNQSMSMTAEEEASKRKTPRKGANNTVNTQMVESKLSLTVLAERNSLPISHAGPEWTTDNILPLPLPLTSLNFD